MPADRVTMAVALGVILVGVIAAAVVARDIGALDLCLILVLAGGIALAEALNLAIVDDRDYSISAVAVLAAAFVVGIAGAVVLALMATLIRGLRRGQAVAGLLLDTGTHVCGAASASLAFGLWGIPLMPAYLLPLLSIAALAGFAYSLPALLVALATGIEARVAPLEVWTRNPRWLLRWAVLGTMALLSALAYQQFGVVGAAAFVVAPMMMQRLIRGDVARGLESMRQLKELNAQLTLEVAQHRADEDRNAQLARDAARVTALEELNRLKTEFISIASHELRTPITPILGFSELALARLAPDDPNYRALSIIRQDALQLSRLIDNVLDVSRIESGRMRAELTTVDLLEVVPILIANCEIPGGKHIIVGDVAPDARWVWADRLKLNQILANLLANAIKYSPDGGTVRLTVRREGIEGESLSVAVSDEGLGIPADALQRIFDRFQRVESAANRGIRGTGLGLYVVRHLVALHGGSIEVKSQVGQGSTFRFTLAAASPGAQPASPDEIFSQPLPETDVAGSAICSFSEATTQDMRGARTTDGSETRQP